MELGAQTQRLRYIEHPASTSHQTCIPNFFQLSTLPFPAPSYYSLQRFPRKFHRGQQFSSDNCESEAVEGGGGLKQKSGYLGSNVSERNDINFGKATSD